MIGASVKTYLSALAGVMSSLRISLMGSTIACRMP